MMAILKSKGLVLCFFIVYSLSAPVGAFIDGSFPRHGSSYQQWPDSLSLHFYDDFQPIELYLHAENQEIDLSQYWIIHHDLLLLAEPDWPNGQFEWHWRVLSGFAQQHQGVLQFAIGEEYQGPRLAETESRDWWPAPFFVGFQFAALLLFALLLSRWSLNLWLLGLWLAANAIFLAHYLTWLLPWHPSLWWQNPWLQIQFALVATASIALFYYQRFIAKALGLLAYALALIAWQPWPQSESPHVHDSKAFSFDAISQQSEPWQRVLPSMPWQFYIRLEDIRADNASQLWVTLYDQQARVVVPSTLALTLSSTDHQPQVIHAELVRDDFLFRLPALTPGDWRWQLEAVWPDDIQFQWQLELQ